MLEIVFSAQFETDETNEMNMAHKIVSAADTMTSRGVHIKLIKCYNTPTVCPSDNIIFGCVARIRDVALREFLLTMIFQVK